MRKIKTTRRIAQLETMLAELTTATNRFVKTTKIQANKRHHENESQIRTEKVIKQKDNQNQVKPKK